MNDSRKVRVIQQIAAVVAVLFGVATLVAGGRVLMGADPGYVIFRPLLIYNVIMGVAYVAAGIMIWRTVTLGRNLAGVIFGLNFLMLVEIILFYRRGGAVAVGSLRAMTLRTVVWLVLFLVACWVARTSKTTRSTGVKP